MADEDSQFRRAIKVARSASMLEAKSILQEFISDHPRGKNALTARYLLGQMLYRGADYEGAVAEFSKIIDTNPEWEHTDRATFGMAMAQSCLLDYAGATKTLKWLLSSYPQSEIVADTRYWLAEFLYRRADYAGALSHFEDVYRDYPDYALRDHALDSIAWCLEQLGRYDEAIEVRNTFLSEFPESPLKSESEFLLATGYYNEGDPGEAVRHYMGAGSVSSPVSEGALMRAGLLLAETGKTQEAIRVLEEIVKEMPSREVPAHIRLALGKCYLKTNEYGKAIRILRTPPARGYNDTQQCSASFQLALAQMEFGNWAAAAEHFSTVLKEDACESLHGSSILGRAKCLINLGQPETAIDELRYFILNKTRAGEYRNTLLALSGLLVHARRFDEAREILENLQEDEQAVNKLPEISYFRGLCLLEAADHTQAAEEFGRFAGMNESHDLLPLARYLEASSYLRGGDPGKALRAYQSFLKQWPDNAMVAAALYQSGLANLLLAKYDDASLSFRSALQSPHAASTALSSLYFLGVSRMKAGDTERAVVLFRSLLDNDPGYELNDRAAFAWGWIELARGNHEEATRIFGRLISEYPYSSLADSAYFYKATAEYRAGLLGAAGENFEKIPALFPDSALSGEALMWAGICAEKTQQPERALELYGSILQLNPSPEIKAEALYALAWTELGLADDAAAGIVIDRLIDEFPDSPLAERAYFLRGRLSFAKKRWEPAMRDLLKVSAAFPESELADDAHFFAARAAYNASDYKAAVRLFQEVAERFPDTALREQAEIEGAECMIDAGDADAAARAIERFSKEYLDSPFRPLALYDMGKALQRAGDFEAAIEQYRAASGDETAELAARARFAIAECLAELDRSSDAIAELVAISQGGFPSGWAERAQLQMARLLERDGRMEEASQIYSSVAATYSDDAAGMVALKAFERLEMEMRGAATR
jgi:TolA-binding protein